MVLLGFTITQSIISVEQVKGLRILLGDPLFLFSSRSVDQKLVHFSNLNIQPSEKV